MKFRVELLTQAEQDLDHILAWLRERSPQGSSAWYQRWLEVLDELEINADIYGRAPEDARHELDIRQIIFKTKSGKPYRAIFTIIDAVFVFCIRGHGQDFAESTKLTLSD